MARHDGDLRSNRGRPLSLDQLLDLLGQRGPGEPAEAHAKACYLSSGEGWREAMKQLRGAFASGVAAAAGGDENDRAVNQSASKSINAADLQGGAGPMSKQG